MLMLIRELERLILEGDHNKVKKFFNENPRFDVNTPLLDCGTTALHLACYFCHEEILEFFLSHPDIDVNRKDNHLRSPLLQISCNKNVEAFKQTKCVNLILKDPRVEINAIDDSGQTLVFGCVALGQVDMIKSMIASGREFSLMVNGKCSHNEEVNVIEAARVPEVLSLLLRFDKDPQQARKEICSELGIAC